MYKLRILVVEDDAIVASDIADYLRELGHRPLGPAYTLKQAKTLIETNEFHLALLDIHLQNPTDGIELAEWMFDRKPVPVIFLSAFTDDLTISRVRKVHPAHFLVKPFDKTQLKIAIEIAKTNFYAPDSSQQISRQLYKFTQNLSHDLSKSEIGVLKLLTEGYSNREMAEKLYLSEHTIKSHLKNIFLKTEAKSRTDLISKLNQL